MGVGGEAVDGGKYMGWELVAWCRDSPAARGMVAP
jgi:hypothetical protein